MSEQTVQVIRSVWLHRVEYRVLSNIKYPVGYT